jgi:hypothetical protein
MMRLLFVIVSEASSTRFARSRVNSAESRNLVNYFKLWITQISIYVISREPPAKP